MKKNLIQIAWVGICLLMNALAYGQSDGLLRRGGEVLFPIGCYELPKNDEALREMTEAGFNLVHCHSRDDLDRAQRAGLLGVVPVPLHHGASDSFKATIDALADHPALAVWEGPDEIVWNFTAASALYKSKQVHSVTGAWWKQTPEAVRYAEEQARTVIPKMREAAAYIRSRSTKAPIWINEALESDLAYVREYLGFVNITGCDIYPVRKENRPLHRMGEAVERWKAVGLGRPVWMVLQAFSWHELGEYYGVREAAYPTFAETRFMAYDVIARGAGGVLYWGSHYLKSEPFRQSIYALIRELSRLQPFLIQPAFSGTRASLVEMPSEGETRGVQVCVKQNGTEWLIILVNEDPRWHMGVEVSGLDALNDRRLERLYAEGGIMVREGRFATRLEPYGVQVFATSRSWETDHLAGRDFQ